MTFINEYASEEDIKTYDLKEVLFRYNPIYRNHSLSAGFQYMWTIDRQRHIYFFDVGGHPGAPEYGIRYILNINGQGWVARLQKLSEGSLSFKEDPYYIVWDLLEIKPETKTKTESKTAAHETIQILKEALSAYGYAGISRQIPNTLIKFNFD